MAILNYISSKQLIGRFLKEYGLEDTAYIEDIPQWIEDAMQIISVPGYYVTRHNILKVENQRCPIPCDIENLWGVYITNSYSKATDVRQLHRLVIRNNPLIGTKTICTDSTVGYGTINGNYIHTSFENGFLYLVYSGIPLDSEGFPLVPKDAKLNEALQYYFVYRMSLSGFKHPVIDFKTAYEQWTRLSAAAGNSLNWMDKQEYQEFTEMFTNPLLGDLNANNYLF